MLIEFFEKFIWGHAKLKSYLKGSVHIKRLGFASRRGDLFAKAYAFKTFFFEYLIEMRCPLNH